MARRKRPRPTGPSPTRAPAADAGPATPPTDEERPAQGDLTAAEGVVEETPAAPVPDAGPLDESAAPPAEEQAPLAEAPATSGPTDDAQPEPPAETPPPPAEDAAADEPAVAPEQADRPATAPPPRRARAPRSGQGRGGRPAPSAGGAGPRADALPGQHDAGPRADVLPGAGHDDASAEKVAAAPAPRPGAEAPASEPVDGAGPTEPAPTPPPQVAGGGRVDALADAILTVARAEGQLIAVADELFQLGRALEASDELLDALADAHIPAPRRQQVVDELLHGRALPLTAAMVTMVVGAGRGRELPRIADALVTKVAAVDNRAVAIVRSAIALDEGQLSRLTEALHQATGRAVEVRVVIDPTVLGGLVTTVGDMVIDGSVRTRLDKLRTTL
ncbi:MAG: ATP synthase F1 subunit delta [Acidimicrobiia bacterium]